MNDPTTSLADLRRRIDAIDDAIHDLLMERAALVDGVRRAKGTADDTPFFRPAREAAILRRLIARHRGPFPRLALVRIWREITAAMVGLQGPFSIAVAVPGEDPGFRDLARDHFGVVAPLAAQRSVRGVIQAVADGSATVGVVPLPQDGEPEPWWKALDGGGSRLRVVGRLPFAPAGGREDELGALVIGRFAQEPSGEDRSLVVVESNGAVSRGALTAAFTAAGLAPSAIVGADTLHLVECGQFVAEDDPRVAALVAAVGGRITRASVAGGYAAPFAAGALAPGGRP